MKIKIKARTSTTWLKQSKGTSDQEADTQKQNTPDNKMSPPQKGHHGVIEFFIGDQTSQPDTVERKAAEGQRIEIGRRRRFSIIMKPQACKDEGQPAPPTEACATQCIGTQDHGTSEEESLRVPQTP